MKCKKSESLKKKKKLKKVQYKKRKKAMGSFAIEIPEEHFDEFVDLICLGANYKEFVDDPDNPGEMIPNPVTKVVAAGDKIESVVFNFAAGQSHRKKTEVFRKAQIAAVEEETSLDTFLKKE